MEANESTLISYQRDDGIHVFKAIELSRATVEEWEAVVTKMLDESTEPAKRLYDLSGLNDIPLHAMRMAMRTRRHRNVHFHYVAVVVAHNRVSGFVDLILRVQQGGRTRIFNSEKEAIHWLHSQVSSPLVD